MSANQILNLSVESCSDFSIQMYAGKSLTLANLSESLEANSHLQMYPDIVLPQKIVSNYLLRLKFARRLIGRRFRIPLSRG
jgi:hypothetical protein